MKILALHSNAGARFYRTIPQLKWMQEQGHEVRSESHDTEHLDQKIDWCDVLVLQMVFSIEWAKYAKSKGKVVIFECDDLIHRTHELHYAYKDTKSIWQRLRWWWRIARLLRTVDALIVSTEPLKRVYGWLAKRVLVFGNYVSLEHWLKEPKKNHSKRVRLLWAGSTSHTGDLYWIKPVIAKILEKYPEVQFIYVGHGGVPTDDLYARFIYGEDVFDGLPANRRESLLAVPANIWPYILPSISADIAIAPLEKNYFNSFKSQCKYLEYGLNAIPGVYSAHHYTDVVNLVPKVIGREFFEERKIRINYGALNKATGIVADTPDEWINALSMLIENATLRAQIGENARAEVIEKYDFRKHAHEWQGFVESLFNERNYPTQQSTPEVRS